MNSVIATVTIVALALVGVGQLTKDVEPIGSDRGKTIEAAYDAMN